MSDENDAYEIKPGKVRPPRLTEKGLHDLARDIVTNVVYISNDEHVDLTFPVMMFAAPKMKKREINNIGALYERWSKAGPTAINGRPMFWSCMLLHKGDLAPLLDEVARLKEVLT